MKYQREQDDLNLSGIKIAEKAKGIIAKRNARQPCGKGTEIFGSQDDSSK